MYFTWMAIIDDHYAQFCGSKEDGTRMRVGWLVMESLSDFADRCAAVVRGKACYCEKNL